MNTTSNVNKGLCVGIDLGTTNSVLAAVNIKNNNSKIIAKVIEVPRADEIMNTGMGAKQQLSSKKRPTLPSYVYYQYENNFKPIVGDFAKRQYTLRPQFVAKSIKSQMGSPKASGLDDNIKDKTPTDIASRILQHLLISGGKVCGCSINDAVITVPANFDSAMCKATLAAAEKAGINIMDSNGEYRTILLPEPNAVLYDLINQIKNGEVVNTNLDLSEKRNVMVFDLGGGTLDITLHEIKYRDNTNNEVIAINDIATNRYTLLGGDDFDELIAEDLFKRYKKQYSSYSDIIEKINNEKHIAMAILRSFAESVKLELNSKCSDEFFLNDNWGDDDEDNEITVDAGGNMGSIGYALDTTYTKEELEEILAPLMANNLVFDDYKRINTIKDTKNIIFPILDVLHKASKKNNGNVIKVDNVVINGGMSKFYLIRERLEKFFGFEPTFAVDPDLSVARGAAIYHYYLQKYKEIEDNMLKESLDYNSKAHSTSEPNEKSGTIKRDEFSLKVQSKVANTVAIDFGKRVLNDSLYLGARNGAVHVIIPTGAELPYRSELMTGFKIEPGQNTVSIPIKSHNLDDTYRTIATGDLIFKNAYPNGAYISFIVVMNESKLITMRAWTSNDIEGNNRIEEGICEIDIGSKESVHKTKVIPPKGTKLNVRAEIHGIEQLCTQLAQNKNQSRITHINNKLRTIISPIYTCANQEEFAPIILEKLTYSNNQHLRLRLYNIARKIGKNWRPLDQDRLAQLAYNEINKELMGFARKGIFTNIVNAAIHTLSICSNSSHLEILCQLHTNSKYFQALLYTHAHTQTELSWLVKAFNKDYNALLHGQKNYLQQSSYAIGVAFRKNGHLTKIHPGEAQVINSIKTLACKKLLDNINGPTCILALGLICDQRFGISKLPAETINTALHAINYLENYYPYAEMFKRPITVAKKMIDGQCLSNDEEQYLLTILEY